MTLFKNELQRSLINLYSYDNNRPWDLVQLSLVSAIRKLVVLVYKLRTNKWSIWHKTCIFEQNDMHDKLFCKKVKITSTLAENS